MKPLPFGSTLGPCIAAAAVMALGGCASHVTHDAPAMWYAEGPSGNQLWLIASIDDLPPQFRPSRLNPRSIERSFDDVPQSMQQRASRLTSKPPSLTWFEHDIRHAFVRSEAVMTVPPVEIKIGDLADLAAETDSAGTCFGIEAHLDAEELAQYSSIFDDLKRPYALPPESLASALFVVAMSSVARSRWDTDVGVDDWYVAQTRKEGKSIIWLEDIRDRRDAIRAALDGQECREQAAALKAMLAASKAGSAGAGKPYQASAEQWRRGRIHEYQVELKGQLARSELLFDAVVARRNAFWVPRIIEQLKSGQPTLVVVDIAHLAGPGNLPQLLERTNFSVRRVQ